MRCRACDRLAQLHSVAVDFPKTGRPASISSQEELKVLVRYTSRVQCQVALYIIVTHLLQEYNHATMPLLLINDMHAASSLLMDS
jgi:hypothetical protein